MSSKGQEHEEEAGSNLDWSPFKQFREPLTYSKLEETFDPTSVGRIIKMCFTNVAADEGICDWSSQHKMDSKLQPCDLPMYLSTSSSLSQESDTVNNSLFHDSINHTCADVWYSLVNNQTPANIINKHSTSWWRDFTTCLQLDTRVAEIDNFQGNLSCSTDESGKPDPMYSAFGRLRNGFYVSGDGHVFRSKVELEAFERKMADLKVALSSELETIQIQHQKLQAKMAEERRLLSQRTESHESESEEAITDIKELKKDGQDKAKGAERKPALFSSMLSFAKTGIQGLFDKTSPNPRRRGAPVCTDQDSDSEDSPKLKQDDSTSSEVCSSFDNHDGFTRQMQNEGGLTYQGTDHMVHQLSYQGLPPPLSLSSIKTADDSNKL